MRKTRFPLTALAALMLLGGCGDPGTAADTDSATRRYGALGFSPCTLDGTTGGGNVEAQCARLEVPENPQAPQGRKIALNVAWLPAARDAAGTADPVFFLAGG
ncbi:MAG TPA: alpha/beta hydrolase, partial [Pseudoxanthomonas sp.]|nr:alpha/beta hydrolase [Pseudoxanthomonas sp.]